MQDQTQKLVALLNTILTDPSKKRIDITQLADQAKILSDDLRQILKDLINRPTA